MARLPAEKNQKLTGATTGDLTIDKPVIIVEDEVTLNGDLTLGAGGKQILFMDDAKLTVNGKLTIAGSDIDKPVAISGTSTTTPYSSAKASSKVSSAAKPPSRDS